MLSKHDLLLATVARKKTDRTPIALWHHWPGDDLDAEALAQVSLEYQKKWDFDWMKITPSHRYAVEDYGRTGRYDGNPEGDVAKGPSPIASIEEWEALKPLDVTTGALGRQLRCLRLIGQQAGDTPFIQTIFNPYSIARFLVDNRCYSWMRKYPTAFKKGLQSITETWVAFVGEVNKLGAAGIYLSVSDASYSLMSWDEYKEFAVPGDMAILSANKGWLTVLHHHGDDLMFEHIAKYPVQVLSWYDRRTWPTLAEGKEIFPGAVQGGINQWDTLLPGSPAEVEAEIREAIAQTRGTGYIVGCGCVTPIPASDINVRTALRVARGN